MDSLLPLKMPCGFVFEDISDECSKCDQSIERRHWMADGAWLSKNALVMKMNAQCPHCSASNAREFRLRGNPDATASFDFRANGKWVSHLATNATNTGRFMDSVKQFLGLKT